MVDPPVVVNVASMVALCKCVLIVPLTIPPTTPCNTRLPTPVGARMGYGLGVIWGVWRMCKTHETSMA